MIKILYLCNKKCDCHISEDCGVLCKHTTYPEYAKNGETVKVAKLFMDRFYESMALTDIAFIEKDS